MAMTGLDGSQVLRHLGFACLMGAVGAGASILLCLCVSAVWDLFLAHWQLTLLLPLFAMASLLLYRFWHLPLDTTTHTVVSWIREDKKVPARLAPGILIGTCLSILGGASVGKESGVLHMGAALGDLVARPFKLKPVYRASHDDSMDGYAAALGMAAAFSALFFAPLGSAMFVFELTRFKKTVTKHCPTIILACFIAFFIASAVQIGDIIPRIEIPGLDWPDVGRCIMIGAVCGIGGTLFIKAIDGLQKASIAICGNYYLWIILSSVAIAALMLVFDWRTFGGTGGNQLALALAGKQDVWGFAIKALLTVLALGLWFKGGEIMPTFTIGALLGASCTVMGGGDPGLCAAVGLVAFFSAMSRCPLAAFLLGCEIFGWTAAPYFAIAILVALPIGKDMGYYGRGAWSVVHRGIRRRGRNDDGGSASNMHAPKVPAVSGSSSDAAAGASGRENASDGFGGSASDKGYRMLNRIEDAVEKAAEEESRP